MKIYFNDYELVRGVHMQEQALNLKINGKREVQITKALRASSVKAMGRGNLQTHISFEVGRRHNSQQEAAHHVLTHASEMMHTSGRLRIEIEAEKPAKYVMEHASIREVATSFKGNASFSHYSILGGELKFLS